MLTITLYTTNDDPKTLDKVITPVGSPIEGEFNDDVDVDILNPEIVFTDEPPACNYVGFNNRFYFVVGLKRRVDGTYIMSLKEDVLQTYKAEIKNLIVLVERQEKEFNLYLKDPLLLSTSKRTKAYTKFPNTFSHKYVSITTNRKAT